MITVTIDSIDRTSVVELVGFRIINQINQVSDECVFDIISHSGQTYVPTPGDEIIVEEDATRIFGGVIVKIDKRTEGHATVRNTITCKDFAQYLNRQLVTERYENETLEDVIDDIITNYTTGFKTNNVNGTLVVGTVAFNRITVTECLEKLARLTNYSWYVDYNQDIHFFQKNTTPAPFTLEDDNDTYIIDSLSITQDISQIRNKIFVRGGDEQGNVREEIYYGDSDQLNWPLANKFAEKPTVLVAGVPQTVGIDYLDDEASFDCFWSFSQKYIRFKTSTVPGTGDEVSIEGIPLFAIIVNVPDPVSIGTYGVYEYSIRDTSIKSQSEAIDRAIAELSAYADTINDGAFQTYNSGLEAGQILTINSTIQGINEQFLIQKVVTSPISPDLLIYNVTIASLRTIGIIEFLLRSLETEEIEADETETILTFLQFADEATAEDDMTLPFATTSPPYMWMPVDPSDDAATEAANPTKTALVWNFGTWEA